MADWVGSTKGWPVPSSCDNFVVIFTLQSLLWTLAEPMSLSGFFLYPASFTPLRISPESPPSINRIHKNHLRLYIYESQAKKIVFWNCRRLFAMVMNIWELFMSHPQYWPLLVPPAWDTLHFLMLSIYVSWVYRCAFKNMYENVFTCVY